MAQGIGARLHGHDLNWQCGSSDCDFCDLGPRPNETRAMWIARLRARYRPRMIAEALAERRGGECVLCPDCGRVKRRDAVCPTCTDPLATVTGVA